MGILDFAEKAAGALAAEKAAEAADPSANLFEKAVAAAAGYEGVAAVKEHFAKPADPATDTAAAADQDAPSTDDQTDAK